MQIEERSAGDVTILDLKGKMTLGEGDETLKDKINSLVHQGRKKLVLNLADVPYIDSAGLGEMVRTYTTVSRQGGSLKLLSLTKRITDLLAITKLLTVFETYDNEADAVRSFSSSSTRNRAVRPLPPSATAFRGDSSAPVAVAPRAVDEEPASSLRAAVRRPPARAAGRAARRCRAFVIFCALSGAVYLFNDVGRSRRRRAASAEAPRPIASGQLAPSTSRWRRPRSAAGGIAARCRDQPAVGVAAGGLRRSCSSLYSAAPQALRHHRRR